MRLKLPPKVTYILDILKRHGHEAYAVGGCVRDSILAREPDDWDITTSARPEEVKRCFKRTIDTGIAHGTVTVMLEQDAFEVTTYRIDGTYSDGRHPDTVTFTPNLADDLMRRDFTINAMAYNDDEGLVDLYGGMQDLQKKRIRCVGKPDERFEEDALRVMRAVRFAAQLGFAIDPATEAAIRRHAPHLDCVSAERIRVELMKLLVSPHPEMMVNLYDLHITRVILPEFDACMETPQNNRHPMYNVGSHTEEGARMAETILRRLKFDNDTRKKTVNLIRWHDLRPRPVPPDVRRAVCIVGRDAFEDYLSVQWADNMAKSEYHREKKLQRIVDVYNVYREILARGDCLSVKELAVDGTDMLNLGFQGPEVGEVLNEALAEVLADPEKNDRAYLLAFAENRKLTYMQSMDGLWPAAEGRE